MNAVTKVGGGTATWLDERVGSNKWLRHNLRKAFPGHWSFLLGEIALYSFIVLLLSGTFLTLWFKPSMQEVVYNGAYLPLRGVHMSEAYASTVEISMDVRGGLLMRQIHHWAALLFLAAMTVHMMRVFFTGAFRKPREMNWVIGILLLQLGFIEGFAGYSLPDDLLSGTGLRIAEAIMLSIPVVGTYISFFVFGGEFPGDDFISRLYTVHVLLIPGILLALITAHMMLLWYQKHTQHAGPGATEKNVIGAPFYPVFMAKAGGFFFIVFGVTALMGAFMQINPIWLYGPYDPSKVTAGSQPDWYVGWLDGALRIFPNLETHLFGYTISWNVFIPGVLLMGLVYTLAGAYPWIEQFVTKDRREHHILDRPRNAPTRTALGVMSITFYFLLLVGGGNDIIATKLDVPINWITWFLRVAVIVLPPIAYFVTKRICLGLQHRDREKVLHGRETGIIKRLPHGEFIEVHEPVSPAEAWRLTAHEEIEPYDPGPDEDENGIPAPKRRIGKVRGRMAGFYYANGVPKPTAEDFRDAHSHGSPNGGDGHGTPSEVETAATTNPEITRG